MRTFTFVLPPSWIRRGPLSTKAETEREARLIVNPHARRWAQALRRAKRYKDRKPPEAAWYEKIAKVHEQSALQFNQALTLVEVR